jgi:hypothetical protein
LDFFFRVGQRKRSYFKNYGTAHAQKNSNKLGILKKMKKKGLAYKNGIEAMRKI